jgi:hypothetical protein
VSLARFDWFLPRGGVVAHVVEIVRTRRNAHGPAVCGQRDRGAWTKAGPRRERCARCADVLATWRAEGKEPAA